MTCSFYRSTIRKANDRNVVVVRHTHQQKKRDPCTEVRPILVDNQDVRKAKGMHD